MVDCVVKWGIVGVQINSHRSCLPSGLLCCFHYTMYVRKNQVAVKIGIPRHQSCAGMIRGSQRAVPPAGKQRRMERREVLIRLHPEENFWVRIYFFSASISQKNPSISNGWISAFFEHSHIKNERFSTFFMPKHRKNAWKNRRSLCGKVENYEMAVFRGNTEFCILRPTVKFVCFFRYLLDKICKLWYTVLC